MAIDPATAKVLAKIATDLLTDKEKRKKLMLMILAPCIGFLLLVAFIAHIVTSPFSALGSFFSGNQLSQVTSIRDNYGLTQILSPDDEGYKESLGSQYDGVTLKSGETQVVYFNQMDKRWSDLSYGTSGTIGSSACGPTSLSIVVSTLTGTTVDPPTMSAWAYNNGYRCENNGSYHSLIPDGSRHFGLNVEGNINNSPQKIIDALSNGKLIIAIMSKGHFTSGGHFIVLRGVTASGKILVADPASYKRSEQEWDLSLIIDESSKGAGSGGAFWIISKT